MASRSHHSEVVTTVHQRHGDSMETLRHILPRDQSELISDEAVRALGYELVTFFEAFDAPGTQEEESDAST